jgi:hypothetical protein
VHELAILSYSKGRGGISEYTNLLCDRLKAEFNVECSIYFSADNIPAKNTVVLIEYAWNLATGQQLLSDVTKLSAPSLASQRRIYVEVHDKIRGGGVAQIEKLATLFYRSSEIANRNKARQYLILPHISYLNVPKLPPYQGSQIKFGWFGFPGKKKRMVQIAIFANKLGASAKFVVTTSTEETAENWQSAKAYLTELQEYAKDHPNIEVLDAGFLRLPQIVESMRDCSHIVFAHRNSDASSGSIMLAKRANRPIISTDTVQARLARVYTTSIVPRRFAFVDAMKVMSYHILREHRFYFSDLKEVLRAISQSQASLGEVLRVESNTIYDGKIAVGKEDESGTDSLPLLVSILGLKDPVANSEPANSPNAK